MADLQVTRRKLKIAFIVLGVIDLIAVGILFSPLVRGNPPFREQQSSLWKDLQVETKQVEPLRGLDKKIVLAQHQIDSFYKDRLPARSSTINDSLGKVANENGVKLGHIKSDQKEAEPVGVTPIEIEADLTGNYLQLVRFLNALERNQIFFIVNSVELAGQQEGLVKLQIKLETYLRTGA